MARPGSLLRLGGLLCLAAILLGVSEAYYEGNYYTTGHLDAISREPTWNYAALDAWPPLCHTGKRQSPISFAHLGPRDIRTDGAVGPLVFSDWCTFRPEQTDMRIHNAQNTISVEFREMERAAEEPSRCTLADPLHPSTLYHLEHLEFHASAEHEFRGIQPDVELHLAFATADSAVAPARRLSIAVLLKVSRTINATSVTALRHMLVAGSLPPPHAMTTCTLTEELSLESFLPAQESYVLYEGSLTTPPCTENVRWVVMTSPILISPGALERLRGALQKAMPNTFSRFGNARPVQSLSGRRVYRFEDTLRAPGKKETNLWRKQMASRAEEALNGESPAGGDPGRLSRGPDEEPWREAAGEAVMWARAHPVPLVLGALGVVGTMWILGVLYRRWRTPSCVVGIDPTEVGPLMGSTGRDTSYGTDHLP